MPEPPPPSTGGSAGAADTADAADAPSAGPGMGLFALESLMKAGAPVESLEEQMALRAIESKLFGRASDPVRFARYVLLDRLGEGASGLVYEAYDPTLERAVAIKLLQSHADREGRGAARLLSEAQSLARLSHPNVVAIYDARAYDEGDLQRLDAKAESEVPRSGVFIVMERLHGNTMREWASSAGVGQSLSAAQRGRVLAQAGRGLMAAHAAGLVHRDFKPDNVIVLPKGEAKVVDFGLAAPSAPLASSGRMRLVLADEAIEPPFQGVGTPAYMAPEQHVGAPADARSDQYAFACTVFEILTGARPFAGNTPLELAAEKQTEELRWPAGHNVDRRVVHLVETALRADPNKRLSDLDALVAALDPRPKRGFFGLFMGTLGLVGGLLAMSLIPDARAECDAGVSAVDGVWSVKRAAQVETSIRRSKLSYADVATAGVRRGLDGWRVDWTQARAKSCARFDGEEGGGDVVRMQVAGELACLDRRIHEARAVVDMLARADEDIVRHATSMVEGLERPGVCVQGHALAAPAPLDAQRAAGLASARALRLAGKYSDARLRLDELERGAAPDSSLGAHLHFEHASIALAEGRLELSEQHYLEALLAAQRASDPEVAVDSWLRLAWVVGVERGDVQTGQRYARLADAALAPFRGDERRLGDLDHTRGGLAYRAEDFGSALAHYRRALGRYERTLGHQHPALARTHNHIANVFMGQKRWDKARMPAERSLELRREALGETHPLLAASHNNLAVIAKGRGDYGLAFEHLERARELASSVQSAAYGVALQLSGEAYRDYGALDRALGFWRERKAWLEARSDDPGTRLRQCKREILKIEVELALRAEVAASLGDQNVTKGRTEGGDER